MPDKKEHCRRKAIHSAEFAVNDDPEETRKLAAWILTNLGPDVPLHFTAFHPDFKLQDKPATPLETLHRARSIAREAGPHYVYKGNIVTYAGSTFCPQCNLRVIRRSWHRVEENLLRDAKCPRCAYAIPGVWECGEAEKKEKART